MGGRGSSSGFKNNGQLILKNSLPELSGSEKQVKWANEIRENAVDTINRNIERARESIKKSPRSAAIFQKDIDAYAEIGRQLHIVLKQITNASQIIDKRGLFDSSRINQEVNKLKNFRKKN